MRGTAAPLIKLAAAVAASTPPELAAAAMAPATCGAANDVPDQRAQPRNTASASGDGPSQPSQPCGSSASRGQSGPLHSTNVLCRPTPGAQASTHQPKSVKH